MREACPLQSWAALLATAAMSFAPAQAADSSQAAVVSLAVPADEVDLSRQDIPKLISQQREQILRLKREADSLTRNDAARAQKLRAVAALEQRIQREAAYPRRRYLSPATRQPVYADYYDALKLRIEERGTRNYPMHDGQRIHGELTLSVTIDADGRIVETELVHGSGDAWLDKKAVEIAKSAAPFGPFSPAMRALADQIVVSPTFRFVRGTDSVEAAKVD